jgi:hypothetical protein
MDSRWASPDAEPVAASTSASALRRSGDVAAASRAYDAVLASFPDDPVTQHLCAELTNG